MAIYKTTCFGFTRQPSSGFTFQQWKIAETMWFRFLYCWNLKPGDGCLVQPKHVAFRLIQ